MSVFFLRIPRKELPSVAKKLAPLSTFFYSGAGTAMSEDEGWVAIETVFFEESSQIAKIFPGFVGLTIDKLATIKEAKNCAKQLTFW